MTILATFGLFSVLRRCHAGRSCRQSLLTLFRLAEKRFRFHPPPTGAVYWFAHRSSFDDQLGAGAALVALAVDPTGAEFVGIDTPPGARFRRWRRARLLRAGTLVGNFLTFNPLIISTHHEGAGLPSWRCRRRSGRSCRLACSTAEALCSYFVDPGLTSPFPPCFRSVFRGCGCAVFGRPDMAETVDIHRLSATMPPWKA